MAFFAVSCLFDKEVLPNPEPYTPSPKLYNHIRQTQYSSTFEVQAELQRRLAVEERRQREAEETA